MNPRTKLFKTLPLILLLVTALPILAMERSQKRLSFSEDDLIYLESSDGIRFSFKTNAALESITLRGLIEDSGPDEVITLPRTKNKILRTTLQLLVAIHVIRQKNRQNEHEEKLQLFLPTGLKPYAVGVLTDFSHEELLELINTANYLGIPDIINVVAELIVDRIQDKSVQEKLLEIFERTTSEIQESRKELAKLNMTDLAELPRDLWKYFAKHLALRKCGALEEYSIANHIADSGSLQKAVYASALFGDKRHFELTPTKKPITSLFGIEAFPALITGPIIQISLYGCLYDFSLDEQHPVHPFKNFINLEQITIQNTPLRTLPAGMFSGLSKLKTLELDSNQLHDLPIDAFKGIPNLKLLNLEVNPLTPKDEEQIRKSLPEVEIRSPQSCREEMMEYEKDLMEESE